MWDLPEPWPVRHSGTQASPNLSKWAQRLGLQTQGRTPCSHSRSFQVTMWWSLTPPAHSKIFVTRVPYFCTPPSLLDTPHVIPLALPGTHTWPYASGLSAEPTDVAVWYSQWEHTLESDKLGLKSQVHYSLVLWPWENCHLRPQFPMGKMGTTAPIS